jgi:hypothetical protein
MAHKKYSSAQIQAINYNHGEVEVLLKQGKCEACLYFCAGQSYFIIKVDKILRYFYGEPVIEYSKTIRIFCDPLSLEFVKSGFSNGIGLDTMHKVKKIIKTRNIKAFRKCEVLLEGGGLFG